LEAQTEAAQNHRVVPHVSFLDGCSDDVNHTLAGDLLLGDQQSHAIQMMLLQLALNHTVVMETLYDENETAIGTALSASSPDEEAFVRAAEYFGYKFLTRDKDQVVLDVKGVRTTFQILSILEYSQQRKMMSVIVQDEAGNKFLFSKGADSKIFSKLSATHPSNAAVRSATATVCLACVVFAVSRSLLLVAVLFCGQFLSEWGDDGLRTLVFAYKPLRNDEYQRWSGVFNAALRNDTEKVKYDRGVLPNAVDTAMTAIETDLILQASSAVALALVACRLLTCFTAQGATANEDRLQDNVPQTIALLSDAGIRVWQFGCHLTNQESMCWELCVCV
jgi:phospholipid-translocating ATPase